MAHISDKDHKRPFSALYVRNFRLFWLAQLLSLTGTWMHQISQAWLVYSLTQSPFYLGLTGAALSLPMLVFTLLAGVIADRYPKKKVLLITQSISILPPLVLGVLSITETVRVWHVIVIAFFMGTLNAIDLPVRQSFLIEMVGRGNLLNAVALSSAAFNGARMIGPAIAGIVISRLDLSASFFINSLSFIPVVIVLQRMSVEGTPVGSSDMSMLRDLKEAVRFILRIRSLLVLLLTIFVFSLLGLPYSHFLPVYAKEVLGVGAEGLGMLMGSAGAGAFLGAMVLSGLGEIRDRKKYMTVAAFLFSLSLIAFSISTNYRVSQLCLLILGFSVVSFMANANSTIQLTAPDSLRGRLMSIYSMVFLGTVPVGSLVVGVLAEVFGTTYVLTAGALLCLIAATVFYYWNYQKTM